MYVRIFFFFFYVFAPVSDSQSENARALFLVYENYGYYGELSRNEVTTEISFNRDFVYSEGPSHDGR